MTENAIAKKAADPRALFVQQIETRLRPEIQKVLPNDVPVEAFERVVQTAVVHNPDLLMADRHSLMTACTEAAYDGLKPDGKEGALVVYNMKNRQTNQFEKKVRWMPMIQGIYKKLRQSNEIATVMADIVYEMDEFSFERGDEERLFHRPNIFSQDRGMPIGAYAIATLKDGSKEREIMSLAEIEQVRAVSKAKGGPWNDWWGEMAKKTVIRRLAKRLPMSAEERRTITRDDDMYDFGQIPTENPPPRPTRRSYQQISPPDTQQEYQQVITGQMPDTAEERGDAPEEPTDGQEGEEAQDAGQEEEAAEQAQEPADEAVEVPDPAKKPAAYLGWLGDQVARCQTVEALQALQQQEQLQIDRLGSFKTAAEALFKARYEALQATDTAA